MIVKIPTTTATVLKILLFQVSRTKLEKQALVWLHGNRNNNKAIKNYFSSTTSTLSNNNYNSHRVQPTLEAQLVHDASDDNDRRKIDDDIRREIVAEAVHAELVDISETDRTKRATNKYIGIVLAVISVAIISGVVVTMEE
jgi:hypothetical protein